MSSAVGYSFADVALWFVGMAFAGVWAVFKDTAIDYRLVMFGAILPDLVDGVLGGPRHLHTLAVSVGLLVAVMLATRGRRLLRRRLLAVPIGTMAHLVLDGVWARTSLFWWPAFGVELRVQGLPSFDRPALVVVLQEIIGGLALLWVIRRFELTDPERRATFLRTGRLGRDLRAGPVGAS